MDYHLDIIDHIDDISSEEWNSINTNDGRESHHHVQFLTNSLLNTFPKSWIAAIIIRDKNGLAGKAPVEFIPYHLWIPCHKLRVLSRAIIGKLSAISVRNPPEFAPEIDLNQAVPKLLKGLETLRREKHSLAIRITNLQPDSFLLKHLDNCGYCITSGQSDTLMDLKWNSFEDYLLSFKKKRRYEVKRQINAGRKANIQIVINDFAGHEKTLYKLMQNVPWKHNSEFRYAPHFITHNSDFFKENVYMLSAKIEEKFIGALMVFKQGKALRIGSAGLDYDLSHKYNVYRLLIYKTIELAIENKYQIIYGGAGTYDIKERLGFVPVPTVSAVWVKPKLLLKVFGHTPSNLIYDELPAQLNA